MHYLRLAQHYFSILDCLLCFMINHTTNRVRLPAAWPLSKTCNCISPIDSVISWNKLFIFPFNIFRTDQLLGTFIVITITLCIRYRAIRLSFNRHNCFIPLCCKGVLNILVIGIILRNYSSESFTILTIAKSFWLWCDIWHLHLKGEALNRSFLIKDVKRSSGLKLKT